MLRRIVLGLIFFTVIALVVMWFLSGAPHQLARNTLSSFDSLSDPLNFRGDQGLRLPWQPEVLFPTINIESSPEVTVESSFSAESPYAAQARELAALELEYDALQKKSQESALYGTQSPYRGMVYLAPDTSTMRETDRELEHIIVSAHFANTGPIDITGWSIESALTRARHHIPPAAAPLIPGISSSVGPVVLDPGATAIITTGNSPLGSSFRENICTGYLQQFQRFSPPLTLTCPAPAKVLPMTPENLERFGDACFDSLSTLPTCHYPSDIPGSPNAACRNYLANELSYTGCVTRNRFRSGFHAPEWRLFLSLPREIWRNSHDAVRLLDAEGRTVDVLTY